MFIYEILSLTWGMAVISDLKVVMVYYPMVIFVPGSFITTEAA